MQLTKTILSALVALAVMYKVTALPQVTTRLPFFPDDDGSDDELDDFYDDDDDRNLSGVIVGTGTAGGPTYVITLYDDDSDDDDDYHRPITATYWGNPAATATVVASWDSDDDNDSVDGDDSDTDDDDDDGFRGHSVACGITNETAVCTYASIGVVSSQTTTSFTTRTRSAVPVTLVASTGSASPAPTGDSSGTSADATGSAPAIGAEQTSGAEVHTVNGIFVGAVSAVLAAVAMA